MGRLLRQGLVERAQAPTDTEASARWRFYCLTPLGESTLRAEVRRLEGDVAVARASLTSSVER